MNRMNDSHFFTPRPLALLAAFVCCTPTLAQTATHASADTHSMAATSAPMKKTLPAVQVQAEREEESTLDAHDLQRRQASNVRDVLQDIPSLNNSTMGTGQFGDIEIRGVGGYSNAMGTGAGRVSMEIDGMEVTQSFAFGHGDKVFGREYLDPADLKAVTVDKGPSAQGLAGSVRFRTKDPQDFLTDGRSFAGEVRLGGRTDEGSLNTGVTLATRLSPDSSAMIGYTHRRYSELRNAGGVGGVGATRTRNDPLDAHSHSLNAKWLFNAGGGHRWTLGLQHFAADRVTEEVSKYGVTSRTRRGVTTETDTKGQTNRQESQRTALMLRHDVEAPTAFFDKASWQLSIQKTSSSGHNQSTVTQTKSQAGAIISVANGQVTSANDFSVRHIALRGDFEKQLGSEAMRHHLRYGMRLQHTVSDMDDRSTTTSNLAPTRDTEREFFPRNSQWQLRLDVSDRITFGNSGWSLTPSVNVTHLRVNPTVEVLSSAVQGTQPYRKTAWGAGMQAQWRINPTHTVQIGLSHATRLPGYGETNGQSYGHWPGKPNPNLKPETARGVELTWASHSRLGRQKTTLFHDRYTNFIEVDCGNYRPTDLCTTINSSHPSTAYGLEWEGRLNLAEVASLPRGLHLNAGLSWVQGKAQGQPRARIDPPHGHITLGFEHPSETWGMQARVRFAAPKRDSDLPKSLKGKGLEGWSTLDLTFHMQPVKNLHVDFGIYNVLDKQYARWVRVRGTSKSERTIYTEPGMHAGLNMRYTF